jgi:hypothetical protein
MALEQTWQERLEQKVQHFADEHIRLCKEQGEPPFRKDETLDELADSFYELLMESEMVAILAQEVAKRVMAAKD